MRFFWDSILWRIFIYYTLLMTALGGLLLVAYYQSVIEAVEQRERGYLQARAFGLFPAFFSPGRNRQGVAGSDGVPHASGRTGPCRSDRMEGVPERGRPVRGISGMEEVAEREGWFFAAVNFDGTLRRPSRLTPDDIDFGDLKVNREFWDTVPHPNYFLVGLISPQLDYLIVGKPKALVYAEVGQRMRVPYLVGTGVFLGASLIGFLIIKRGLSPITRISRTAQRMAEGELSKRIDIQSQRSELGQLGQVLNQTFDRLEHLLKQQVQFTSDASHDLRTPIAAILADCQFVLKRPREVERYRETIEVCHESAQHMRMLVDQLGLLARFDADHSALAPEPIDLKEELEAVCHVLKPVADKAGIYLGTDLKSTRLKGDPLRLRQVWLNLLNNALCYTGQGGHVKVRAGRSNGIAWVEVADDGIGIPPDALEFIFDRFYRVDDSRNVKTGGAGLGLAICKSIIEAHGGIISVESQVEKGSCFRVELPRT